MLRRDTRALAAAILVVVSGIAAFLVLRPHPRLHYGPSPALRPVNPRQVAVIADWVRVHSIRLAGVSPALPHDDLLPLKQVLKDVRAVGLGEATHGTREFFQFKHRLFEFLVTELGFRAIAVESSYAACRQINEYVLHGKGNRAAALAGQGFWTVDTQEVGELVDWMRAYNERVAEASKVKFFGIDIQVFDSAIRTLEDYIRRVDPDYLARAQEVFKPLEPARRSYEFATYEKFVRHTPEMKSRIRSGLYEMLGFLQFNRSAFIAKTSADEFEDAAQCARVLAQFHDAYSRGDPTQRDMYMASNLLYILGRESADTKIAVWAHNGHVAMQPTTLGGELRRVFGPGYYAVAITFNRGAFQARDGHTGYQLREFRLAAAPSGSLEWYLSQAQAGDLLIDFRSTPRDRVISDWLSSTSVMHSVGSVFSDGAQGMGWVTVQGRFDALVLLDSTTRAMPNPPAAR